jgi:hypothetical protein
MTKRSRRQRPPHEPKAVTNGAGTSHDVGPDAETISAAIDAAAARHAPTEFTLNLARQPVRLHAKAKVSVTQGSDPNVAHMLLLDADGVWHGVIFEPGLTFEIRRAEDRPAAALWTPPGSRRPS